MARPRRVSDRAVRYDLLNGMSVQRAAVKHKCSVSLIRKIRDEQRNTDPQELCTHCGSRPKGHGLRFLCEICFKYVDDAEDTPPLDGYKLPDGGWEDLKP